MQSLRKCGWYFEASLGRSIFFHENKQMVLVQKPINLLYLIFLMLHHIWEGCTSFFFFFSLGVHPRWVIMPGPSPTPSSGLLIAPHCSSATPFQHNNSKDAPGASCHPEPSFVLPLLSLLDWMFFFSLWMPSFPPHHHHWSYYLN